MRQRSALRYLVPFIGILVGAAVAGERKPADVYERYATLDPHLTIHQKAPTLDALVKQVRPRFVWNDYDLLWVVHDEAGKVGFAMNRAYALELPGDGGTAYLLEADAEYVCKASLGYTRAVDKSPTIIARDPVRGVVYRTTWNSAEYEGTGHVRSSRDLFLLCDGKHRWHFLGEGPEQSTGRNGPVDFYSGRLDVSVRWTDQPAAPVEIHFSQVTKWETPGRQELDYEYPSLVVRKDGVLGGGMPGSIRWVGSEYTQPVPGERLDSFVRRVAIWKTYLRIVDNVPRRNAMLAAVQDCLLRSNPGLRDDLSAVGRVELPEDLWRQVDRAVPRPPTSRPANR